MIVARITVNDDPHDLRGLLERCQDLAEGRRATLDYADQLVLCKAASGGVPYLDAFTRRLDVCVPEKDRRLSEEKAAWIVKAAQEQLGSRLSPTRACAIEVADALKDFERHVWPTWRGLAMPPLNGARFNIAAWHVLKLHVEKHEHAAPSYRTVQRALEDSASAADNDSA